MPTETAKPETYIQELLDADVRLFPLNPYRLPLAKGWQNTPPNAYTIEQLTQYDCYARALDDDDLVLDYDPRREVNNEKQLLAFFKTIELETPVETYIVATGGVYDQGQGYHVYFKKPPDFPVRGGTIPGFPAIEIKTKGRYVVAPGSMHEHGRRYEVVRGSNNSIMVATTKLLQACERTAPVNRQEDIESDSPEAQQRFIDYIHGGGHTQGAYACACAGRDFGLSQNTIANLLLKHWNEYQANPNSEQETATKVAHAFEYAQNSQGSKLVEAKRDYSDIPELKDRQQAPPIMNGNGLAFTGFDEEINKKGVRSLLPTFRNAIAFLIIKTYRNVLNQEVENPLYNALRYNLFSHNIEFIRPAPWHNPYDKNRVWTDEDTVMLKAFWMQHTALYNVPNQIIEDAIVAAAYNNQYHPVRDWLRTLTWDGTPRLDNWLPTYTNCTANDYTREVGRLTLLAAVARVMKPGCKHDTMLILEGKQDIGKSRLVKAIGGQWYADVQIDPHSKDCIDAMQGAWILEASELEFMRRSDISALKRFLTLQEDKIRLAYARRAKPLPRQGIFIGTVNPTPEGYLNDQTGNRRYLPVKCRRIDVDGFKRDRDQIFAEAYQRFQNGERWYTTDERVKRLMTIEQDARQSYFEWAQTIDIWWHDMRDTLPPYLTTEMIASQCLGIPRSKQNNRNTIVEIHRAIREGGFKETERYSKKHKRSIRCWERKIDYTGVEDL